MGEGSKRGYEGTMFGGDASARKVLDSVSADHIGDIGGVKAIAAYVEHLKSGGSIVGLEGEILHYSDDPVLTRVVMMGIVKALVGEIVK